MNEEGRRQHREAEKKGVFKEPLLVSVTLLYPFLLPMCLNYETEAKLIQIIIYNVLTYLN